MLSLCGPYTRLGTLLSALIVVSCIIGITMHKDFYAGKGRKEFFCFYTNVSNLAVLLYFALAAPMLYKTPALHPMIAHAEFAVMMCIMLTLAVFHLLLFPAIHMAIRDMPRTREYRILRADNFIIHYLVPLSVFAYWLLCSPNKQTLNVSDALYWTALPVVYILLIFVRAKIKGAITETSSPYPYPFLDRDVLGTRRVAGICAALYAICLFAGLIVIAGIRLIFA